MNMKFDLIDTFSRRPSLSTLASAELRAAVQSQYPSLTINPEIAVITGTSDAGQPVSETLIASLRENFSTGKTLRWKNGEFSLVADPRALVPVTLAVDVEQLAILLDTVSLSLPGKFMQSLVDFWDRPGKDGISPWKHLAQALERQSPVTVQAATTAVPPGDVGAAVTLAAPENPQLAAFGQKALDALQAQLSAIQGVLVPGLGDFDEIERYLAKITDVSVLLGDSLAAKVTPRVSRLDQLPEWLRTASSADRLDYSRKLAALAVASARACGHAWNDDLPPILDYANKALQDTLCEDHPEATWLTLDDVTVHIAKVVAAAVPSAGQVITTGSVEHVQMSVATFALENLSSLPNGTMTLSTRDGGPLPDWLTPDYLKQLVIRVDIGRTYPALVARYLITDLTQAARRQILFAGQLRVQLPLKALEQKIRGQGDLTQAGYQLVCSLMELPRAVNGSVLRPLAWVAQPGATADHVNNMFVIGGADTAVGPWVLYRPMADVPLTEFATWTKLRDAIASAGELQEQVLTWMTEHARERYANGGFDQPHIIRFGLGSDFASWETPAPAQLDVAEVQGDVMSALFSANAKALVDLADRESVSNAESRWALIQRGGWLALDAVMPFLSGSVGAALWLVQLMTTVDQVLAAEGRKAGRKGGEAWNALLLTVSMILLHQGFAPRRLESRRSVGSEPSVVEHVGQEGVAAAQDSDLSPTASDTEAVPLLDFSWSSVGRRLTEGQTQSLERLKVSPEPQLGVSSVEPGREGLYRLSQHWYVRLDSGVYKVSVADEEVCIIDTQNPLSRGPHVRRVGQVWALDLSLRLRGGGPKRTARQMALENAATLKRVTERDAVLEQQKNTLYHKFLGWDRTCRSATGQLPPGIYDLIETDLNALRAVFEERNRLQLTLRPADRVGDKVIASDLEAVARRIAFLEGVLLENVGRLVRTQLAGLYNVADGTVTADNIGAYLTLFEDLLKLQERGVRWSEVRETLWEQLRGVPKVGETFWREEVLDLQRNNLSSHLEWRIQRMWSLLELSFVPDDILAGLGARELKGIRTDDALHAAFISHSELEKPNDYTLAEQIDVLESSLREYQRCSTIAMCAKESAIESLNAAQFERFLEDLSWVSGRAEMRLSELIRESAEPPQQPSEYRPRVRQPRKRVFKTRGQRTLVGRIREGEPDLSGTVVDVTQPMSEAVIGTYHLHESGEWVEVEVARPSRPSGGEGVVAPAELMRQASAALERVEPDINNARRQSRRAGEPADMQDILVHKAELLNTLADRLATRSSDAGLDENAVKSLHAQAGALRSAASRLVQEGRTLRIAMIKAQPPTAARLSYLVRENEASIARFDGRKNMSGTRRNDFLQEYVIRDKEQHVLWWAHFHYASEGAAADAFTAAHLKLPEQRFIGYKAQVKAAKDNKEVVSIYRSFIGKDIAQRLFTGSAPEPVEAND